MVCDLGGSRTSFSCRVMLMSESRLGGCYDCFRLGRIYRTVYMYRVAQAARDLRLRERRSNFAVIAPFAGHCDKSN